MLVTGLAALNASKGGDFGSSLEDSFNSVSKYSMTILGPVFNFLLGLDSGDDNIDFLMVLAFILISIIIVGTLDSVNIFGDDKTSKLANFAIGIIVAIIGVRFMPADMWGSLTAPSSAFVATILVGAPFAALFFVTMKIKLGLAIKLLWLFYLVFMSYLIFSFESATNDFKWIYFIFLVLAGIMMAFDASVRSFISGEKHKLELEELKENVNLLSRQNLRTELKKLQEIVGDAITPNEERTKAKKRITEIRNILVKEINE